MEEMSVKKLLLWMFCLICMCLLIACEEPRTDGERGVKQEKSSKKINISSEHGISFSEEGYFFSEDLSLEILSDNPGKIYYTTDGTEPDQESEVYKKPIRIKAYENVTVTSVKAKAFFEDGTESETIVHTYFVGENVESRYDTLIFSVTTDPYNLYDYEYGIFVEGKLRDDWIKENPNDKIEPNDSANYNMRGKKSERKVYLEILEPDGTKVVAQNAGIRTYGGWSRANAQKSIKIYARKEYGEDSGKLRYEFFPEKKAANGSGKVQDSFKQLVLRNCGNDNGFAFIRDELLQTLASQTGYQDYEAVRPAAMYINGEYRGFFWLHEVYCDDYFEENYGDYQGDFEILEGGDAFKEVDADGENAQRVEEYQKLYDTYAKLDLTDDQYFNQLCELIDVQNYLEYFAFQTYIGNGDWPHNNYKCYRYYATNAENYGKAPFDGKWRYLLHDLDFSTGIYEPERTGPKLDKIVEYVGKNGEIREICPLFGQLMRRQDCREIFIKKTTDLANGVFAPDYFNRQLETMHTLRKNELSHIYGKGLLADWVLPNQLSYQMGKLKEYIRQRGDHILTQYQEYFGLGALYTLTVLPVEGVRFKVNSFTAEGSFTGRYYEDFSTTIKAVLADGQQLDYWLVNGVKTEGEELVITAADVKDGKVEISCKVK
jgi:hypothetical protein